MAAKLQPTRAPTADTSPTGRVVAMGQLEFRRCNLFEDGAKLDRALVPECVFELTLRCSPAGTGLGRSSLSGLCQRYHAAAPIAFGNLELDQTALFERTEKVPQCRAIHNQKACQMLDRIRTVKVQPRQEWRIGPGLILWA